VEGENVMKGKDQNALVRNHEGTLPIATVLMFVSSVFFISPLPGCSSADFSVAQPLTISAGDDGGAVQNGDGRNVALGDGQNDQDAGNVDHDSKGAHDVLDLDREDSSSLDGIEEDDRSDVSLSFSHHPPFGPDYDDPSIAAGVPGDVSTYPQALVDNSIARVKASEPPADWTDGPIDCPGLSDPCSTTVEKPHGGAPWTAMTWCRDGSSLVLPADGLPECPKPDSPKWW
jgi:hypothetical protein